MNRSRRTFLGLTALGLASGGYSFFVEPEWLRVKRYEVATPKWPETHKPLHIAFASDFHVGCPSVSLEKTRDIVRLLNGLGADIILLGGDYLIQDVILGKVVAPEPIGEALSGLTAPLGVYSVLGNHDWYGDGQAMWRALERGGITVLENSAIKVDSGAGAFWVAGLADDTMRIPDYPKTMSEVSNDVPVLLLSHDPAPFMDVDDRPVLTLCGHTHGGQVTIPFISPIIIPGRAPLRYAYGHVSEQGRDMIVSGGIGTSILPVRFGRRPEIVSITIRHKAAAS